MLTYQCLTVFIRSHLCVSRAAHTQHRLQQVTSSTGALSPSLLFLFRGIFDTFSKINFHFCVCVTHSKYKIMSGVLSHLPWLVTQHSVMQTVWTGGYWWHNLGHKKQNKNDIMRMVIILYCILYKPNQDYRWCTILRCAILEVCAFTRIMCFPHTARKKIHADLRHLKTVSFTSSEEDGETLLSLNTTHS